MIKHRVLFYKIKLMKTKKKLNCLENKKLKKISILI
jgi:hypothetical protein